MSEEALQIVEKRRATKSKGEKERFTYLNAEFLRIARRDKKACISDQWHTTVNLLHIYLGSVEDQMVLLILALFVHVTDG